METYTFNIVALDMENAGMISSKLKRILASHDVDKHLIRRALVACYEAEINVVIHSYGGQCNIYISDELLKMDFIDTGPGIPSIENAMKKGWSTASKFDHENGFGAGMGFPNMQEASDNLIVKSSKAGTIVEIYINLR